MMSLELDLLRMLFPPQIVLDGLPISVGSFYLTFSASEATRYQGELSLLIDAEEGVFLRDELVVRVMGMDWRGLPSVQTHMAPGMRWTHDISIALVGPPRASGL
jgi:hypothetical protein